MSDATSRFLSRCMAFALTRRLRRSAGGAPPSSASASPPRLRIVPDVPITRVNPRVANWSR